MTTATATKPTATEAAAAGPILEIADLRVTVDDKEILRGIDLAIRPGEVHAIMGPNGSGKSTLAHVLSGRDGYDITGGTVRYMGEDLLALEPEERAQAGVFLAFQYPVEIPGVPTSTLLRTGVNAVRRHRGQDELDAFGFLKAARATLKTLKMDEKFLSRAINVGFSGGEKKRNEVFQMTMLEPYLAIMDETDSGLDIDALKIVSDGVNALRGADRAMLIITHYQRLLDYIVPDKIHVLAHGRIARTGGKDLARELEDTGYAAFEA